jgi:hypothetical protein
LTTIESERPKARHYRLAEAARDLYPVPVNPATLFRHITKGKRLRSGVVIRLKATCTPGGWVITAEAVEEFLEALTRDRLGDIEPAPAPLTSARRRAVERAEAACDALGI